LEQAIARQPDMVVVGRAVEGARSPDALLELARTSAPDVVVLGLPETELSAHCLPLLAEQRGLSVLALEASRGIAHVYQLRPHHIELGAVSPDDMATAIRRAARPMRLI
jgi:hypothetical protein